MMRKMMWQGALFTALSIVGCNGGDTGDTGGGTATGSGTSSQTGSATASGSATATQSDGQTATATTTGTTSDSGTATGSTADTSTGTQSDPVSTGSQTDTRADVTKPPADIAVAVGLTGDAAKGRTLFSQNCAGCHGAGDKRPSNAAADTANPERPFKQIVNGGGRMQAFGARLSSQDVADIVAFLRAP